MEFFECEKCNGSGILDDIICCPDCLGEGQLNWIEKVFGKNINLPILPIGYVLSFMKNSKLIFKIKVDFRSWMECDGRLLYKNYYSNLYKAIGNEYGESEDKQHFRIPDYRFKPTQSRYPHINKELTEC